jgi:hypothetical protein
VALDSAGTASAAVLTPGSPEFLTADARNFILRREDVRCAVVTGRATGVTVNESGQVLILLKGGGYRRLILIEQQDLEHVRRVLAQSLGRVEVVDAGSPAERAKQGRSLSAPARWYACVGVGILLTVIAVVFIPLSYRLARPVPFERLGTAVGAIDRVDVVTPRRSGRYVRIRLAKPGRDLVVHEVRFLESGPERLLTLRRGDHVTAWLAPKGWATGDGNTVWQLYRHEPLAGGIRPTESPVLEHDQMARAVAAGGPASALSLTGAGSPPASRWRLPEPSRRGAPGVARSSPTSGVAGRREARAGGPSDCEAAPARERGFRLTRARR